MSCHKSTQIRAPAVSSSLGYRSAVRITRAFLLLNNFFLKICRLNGWKQPFLTKTYVFLCCRQLKSCKKKNISVSPTRHEEGVQTVLWTRHVVAHVPSSRFKNRRIAKDETASWIKQNTGRPTSFENYCSLRGRLNVISYCSAKMNRVQENL